VADTKAGAGRASSADEERRFPRPWEEPLEPSSEEPSTEPPPDEPERPDRELGNVQVADLDFLAVDEAEESISEAAYLQATTAEYRDLAEEIARGGNQPATMSAMAASMAGVGTGLVDFEDVTGRRGLSEEEVEHVEQAAASDLTLRVISAIVLVGLFTATLLLGGWLFTLFVGAVMVIGVGEFYATLRRHGYVPLALFGLLGVLGSAIGAHLDGPGPVLVTMLVMIVAVVLFFSVMSRRRPLENAAVTILGATWVAPLALASSIRNSPQGIALIILAVLLAALYDIGAFFTGRAVGRHQLAPSLSPKKTWEGLIGGIVTTVAVAAFLSTVDYFPLDLGQAMILAVIVIVLAPLGDAAESMIKRGLGVKDMGSVLPGHGGMLDRIDAFVFVVPAAFLFFRSAGLL
jgi:phosphatidate cytidylyltransferase